MGVRIPTLNAKNICKIKVYKYTNKENNNNLAEGVMRDIWDTSVTFKKK